MTQPKQNSPKQPEPEPKKRLEVEETELADMDLDSVSGGARSIVPTTFTNPRTITTK